MQRKRALVASTRVIALSIGQFAVPAAEIDFAEAIDIAAPIA